MAICVAQSEDICEIQCIDISEGMDSEEDTTKSHILDSSKYKEELDLGTKTTGPMQPILDSYPYIGMGKDKRCFQTQWYKSFPWIEYSITRNSIFCFPCRNFPTQPQKGYLINQGYQKFRKVKEYLTTHGATNGHAMNVILWNHFKQFLIEGTIKEKFIALTKSTILERREYLKRLFKIIILCGKLELPLRGHYESKTSNNQGNYCEILNCLKEYDPFLIAYKPPGNAHYCSPQSQNQMLSAAGNLVVKYIASEIREAGYFAVMADDTRDVSSYEQFSICVRYVDKTKTPKESFIPFQKVEDLDAESLTKTLITTLNNNSINAICVAQAYDGASVMKGHLSGVQERYRQNHKMAIYVHCYAHKLNLVLISACKSVPQSRKFFNVLEDDDNATTLLHNLPDDIFSKLKSICTESDLKKSSILINKLRLLQPAKIRNKKITEFNAAVQKEREFFKLGYP
ncbi:zinc finger MYM-type protein 1-like [Gordionus sp. m RMFG-2023]|uniref:zinc finger MYM-type protein 1-like n=1 Tax=Gordionus sp. m RMFG-2023 TaxID=3053472 RepID=UPI0031FD55A8